MKYILRNKKKVFFITLLLGLTVFAFYYIYGHSVNHDALMIKQKYEFYNDKENIEEEVYPNVTLDSNADIINVTVGVAIDKLENESGILFIGDPTNFKSREALPILMDAIDNQGRELLYLDGTHLRDEYIVKKKEVKKVQGASKSYYKLLELLDEYLEKYIVYDEEGNPYQVDEKRLEYPTVVFFNDGEITNVHIGTTDNNNWDNKEQDKLLEIYNKYIEKMGSNVCTTNTSC